jgi:hypothetical protein
MDTEAVRSRKLPIELVREGMRVVDRDGKEVGPVELVKFGDPDAVTTMGQGEIPGEELLGMPPKIFTPPEPRVVGELAERLLRKGFLKVDDRGVLDRDYYVEADRIADVEGNVVRLKVDRDALPREL